MTAWKNFLIRAGSALAAIALIVFLYFTYGLDGLKFIISVAVAVGTRELSQILFQGDKQSFNKWVFLFLSLVVFTTATISLSTGLLAYSLILILFIIILLLAEQHSTPLEQILSHHSRGALGFFYMGLLPAFAYRILDGPQGLSWFIYLLVTVFAGDTLAYVFGVLIGKHKIMPTVSPKKTWQGSFGGILGSLIAGYICWLTMLSQHPVSAILALSILAGVFGQFGDFFESLIKRVANVKDSGRIMPGHGGVLDRIDGVLFASPVVLAGVLILAHLSS